MPRLGALALLVAPALVAAAPQDGNVAAGQAQIARNGNLTSISQQSQRAVIDWRSFSIGAGEAVDFRQPSASAVTLNRVVGSDPSSILGRMTANGTVFLVNPNGVLFGQGAQVNVGGLVASTANITNANFMAGIDRFDQPGDATARVENQGVIRIADNGIAALVGRRVSNSGFIVARLGKVALAGGDAFVLDLAGDRLVSLVLDTGALERTTDAAGNPLAARVDQTGNIQAAGGRVELTADTVSRLLNNVINVGGDIRATAAEARDGVIRITGGASTDVAFSGVAQAGGGGALVAAAGRDITLAAGAQVDLSAGADLRLDAVRDIRFDAPLNALVTGAVPGGGIAATAGNDLVVNAALATANGTLSLAATAGRLTVADGVLLQAGDQTITLAGGAGLTAQSVLTGGAVSLASSAGTVVVRGAIAAPSAAGAAAAAAGNVSVQGRDGVTLAGVRSGGTVDIGSAAGPVVLGGAIDSVGAASVTATAGALTVGVDGIRVSGPGQALSVRAGGNVTLEGDLVTQGGGINVASTGGSVTARVATPGANPQAGDATLDAGADAATSLVDVRARGTVTLGGIVAQGGVTVRSDEGNVLMLSPLGGANTGYRNYADGYQAALRPDVGTLAIEAPNGSVELNGLNLDGLRNATDTGHGLRVVAGRMILSNDTIAVNKGDILLQGGDTLATDGVYLGGNVFSRGFDQVVGGVRNKIGYGIRIAGQNLGVFDNGIGVAELPGLFRVTLNQAFVLDGVAFTQVFTDQSSYVVDENGDRVRVNANGQRVQTGGQFVRVARDCVNANCGIGVDLVRTYAENDPELDLNLLVLGQAARRTVAKIEIANNVANYQQDDPGTAVDERSVLVAPSGSGAPPQIAIDVTSIGGVRNVQVASDGVGSARQALAAFPPFLQPNFAPLVGLSEASVRVTPAAASTAVASTRGIAIKLLGFEAAADASTELWSSTLAQPLIAVACGTVTSGRACDPFGNQSDLLGASGSTTYQVQLFVPPRGFAPPNISQTFPLANATTLPWTQLGSSGGRFQMVVQGYFRVAGGGPLPPGAQNCTPTQLCTAVFNFQLQGNATWTSGGGTAPTRIAEVTGIAVNGVSANWESIPSVTNVAAVGVGRVVNVMFGIAAPTVLSEPGRAQGVEVNGALAGGTIYAGPVSAGGTYQPSAPVDVTVARSVQSPSGQIVTLGFGGRGYTFGRVTLESSVVPGTFGTEARGTRVVLFDGILGNASGATTSDQNGGFLHIPGFSGIPGTNNSTTGFSSVGGSTGAIGGSQAQGGTAVVAAPTAPEGQPFDFRPTFVDDRASQDALGSPVAEGVSGARGTPGTPLQLATSPTRQADLGRGGSLGGAAANVFTRTYRLAVSTDSSVCSPQAIEPPPQGAQAGAGRPASAQGSAGSAPRPCLPAGQ